MRGGYGAGSSDCSSAGAADGRRHLCRERTRVRVRIHCTAAGLPGRRSGIFWYPVSIPLRCSSACQLTIPFATGPFSPSYRPSWLFPISLAFFGRAVSELVPAPHLHRPAMNKDPQLISVPPRFAHRVSLLDTENAFTVAPLIVQAEAEGQHVIRCNIGEPDFPLPDHIREEVKRHLDLGATGYVDPQGLQPLREAIADDVGSSRGIDVSPERVVVFPGAKVPIGLCQQTYCDPGDEVVYPSPGFPIYESFTRYVGADPVPIHLREADGFAVTEDLLEPLLGPRTRLIFLNSPANPTGGVTSDRELEAIADLIFRKAPPNVRIFSDEIYERILFDGSKHASIASVPGMAERTIIVSGASKSYAWTGGRVGWAIFPTREEAAVFRNLNINYFSCIPAYNQMGAVAAIQSPESRPFIARMVTAFQERRDLVVERLNAIPGITCAIPKGAFYVFPNVAGVCTRIGAIERWESLPPDVRGGTSPSTLLQLFLLFRYGVCSLDRRSFGTVGAEGHFLRLSIATPADELRQAADRIAAAASDEAGFAHFFEQLELAGRLS
ncbi:MAG: aminotransferase class I/II-fold pyridoxal phosphate-dependent enzyme [Gemmatimonas sp.]|nr:aminotransferase class I/II-fold pyridoxal phosphate-dependent enzyme [Gemmatimonas sp.]